MQFTLEQYASLIIITPAADSAWIQALVPLLRRGVIPTVLLLDSVSFGGTGSLSVTQALLTNLGVAHHVITRDLLDQPKARPDQRRYWGRPVSATSPMSARQPRRARWKVLS
jgi:hypothetical protein